MSFEFLLVLLLIVALAFVLVPYLRPARKVNSKRSPEAESNVQIYAARLGELELELAAGSIQRAEFDQLKDELGLSLLVDTRLQSLAPAESNPLKKSSHLMLAVGSVLIIVLGSWLMYAKIGAWPAVEVQEAASILRQQNAPPEKLQALIQLLNNRLIDAPQDSNLWYLLGHTQLKHGSFRQSANAFERLSLLVGADINVDTSLAQARYMADEGKISEMNRQAMQDILKRAPHQPLILEILAIEAFQNRDATAAIGYLQQGLAGGLRGERADSFRSGIERALELQTEMGTEPADNADFAASTQRGVHSGTAPAGANARIEIQVSINPAIQASPETAVFIIAREQGGMPMPLAVKKLSVGDLPVEIVFSDADAMVKSRLLSQFSSIELVARLSFSGQPSLQPGDIETRVGNVAVTRLDTPVVLRLEP